MSTLRGIVFPQKFYDRPPITLVLLLTCLFVWNGASDHVAGQNRPAADFLGEMVKVLMDSRSDPSTRADSVNRPTRGQRDRNPKMRELRANLAGFAQSVSQLVATLYQDVNRTPGLRALMGETLQVNAQATLLARMSAEREQMREIAQEFSELDQRWRMVSFRLKQLRYLTTQATEKIQRVDEFHARVSQLLEVHPQADREAVVRQATSLSTDIRRLLEEIDIEVPDSNLRRNLLIEGRQVYQQARRVAGLASQSGTLEEVQEAYRRFGQLWNPLAVRLRTLNIRHVDRQMQRVQASERALEQQLLMAPEVDRGELAYLTQLLQRDLDQLMDGITLRQLTELTSGRDQIVGHAGDFYSACGDFADCVRNGESIETMADLYDYLDSNWRQVATVLRSANTSESQQVYGQLDRSMTEIREVLSVQPGSDQDRVLQIASRLQDLADHLDNDVRSAIAARPNSYPAQFRAQVLRVSEGFKDASAHLSSQVANGNLPANRLRELTIQISQRWENLLPLLNQFSQSSEREHFWRLRQQITPVVVDLQAMLAI